MTHKMIIGIDLAKHVFQVCMVNHKGTRKTNTTVTHRKLLALIARQPPALVVMEACSGAHDWARRFRAVGHDYLPLREGLSTLPRAPTTRGHVALRFAIHKGPCIRWISPSHPQVHTTA